MLGLFFLFVAVCSADWPVPPQQFEADATITAAGTQLPGHVWLDWTQKGAHVQIPILADLVATPDAAQGISSLYGVISGTCNEAGAVNWSQLPSQITIPANATQLPNQVINGVACQGWNYTAPSNPVLPYVSFYLSAADHSIVRLSGKALPPGSAVPISFLVDFSNTKIGPVAASNFAKPASCP